ncbi:MAG: tyrosinase family protein [Pseudomonadota bacterium]
MKSQSKLSRREALMNLAKLSAGFSLLSLFGATALAQNPADYPVDCTPPKPSGPATPFVPGKIAALPRKSAFALSTQEIASLTLGFQKLRDLTVSQPNNPLGWLLQSYVHCWYCGGGTDGKAGEEIHSSWWFLPWHRCYLYFLERTLSKLANDPNLRLPYWDWSTQSNLTQTLPGIYNNNTSSLYDALRGVTTGDIIPSEFVGPQAMSIVLNASNFSLFGGVDTTINGGQAGQLERIPHNNVHNWTGTDGDTPPTYGSDMGVLATAARDPVFFCHHANVDRMWPSWQAVSTTHTNPTDSSWLNHSWTFYDENGVWTSIKVSDVIDSKNLGYFYDNLATVPASKNKIMTANTTGNASTTTAAAALTPLIAAPKEARTLKNDPATHEVALPQVHKTSLQALSSGTGQQYLLTIDGVLIAPYSSVSAKVYVNYPKANAATTTEIPNFVGFISSVAKVRKGSSHTGHNHGPQRQVFEIGADLAAILVKENAVKVTIVPINNRSKKPKTMEFSYGEISLQPLK